MFLIGRLIRLCGKIGQFEPAEVEKSLRPAKTAWITQSPRGLDIKQQAGCTAFDDALQRLLYPETTDVVAAYFNEQKRAPSKGMIDER